MRERKGQNLVRTARSIVAIRAINHIIKKTKIRGPKSPVEGFLRARCQAPHGCRSFAILFSEPLLENTQGVVPECVDFNRFPAAWSNDPIPHLRVHPGRLISQLAL